MALGYDGLSWWTGSTCCRLCYSSSTLSVVLSFLPDGLPWLLSGFRVSPRGVTQTCKWSSFFIIDLSHFHFPNLTWKLELFLWSLSGVTPPWKSSSLDKREPLTLPRNLASLQSPTFLSVIHSGKKKKKKKELPPPTCIVTQAEDLS